MNNTNHKNKLRQNHILKNNINFLELNIQIWNQNLQNIFLPPQSKSMPGKKLFVLFLNYNVKNRYKNLCREKKVNISGI